MNPNQQSISVLKSISQLSGIFVTLLGLFLFLSWQFNFKEGITLLPATWPVPYSASICLFLSGLALISVFAFQNSILVNLLGGSIFLIGILRLIEILFFLDFGIQHIALASLIYKPVVFPPMALFGSIGFVLTGLTFLLWPNARFNVVSSLFLLLTTLFIFFLALVGLLNNLLPFTGNFSWEGFFPIHFYIALGLTFIGLGLVTARFYFDSLKKINLFHWLPVLVSLALLFFTIAFTLITKAGKETVIKKVVENKANTIKVQVVEYLKGETNILIRMVHRIEMDKQILGYLWEKDANSVVNDIKELKAIALADTHFKIQNIIPSELKANELFQHFTVSDELKTKFEESIKDKTPFITLSPDNANIFISYPIYLNNVFQGVLIFLIDTKLFFENALRDVLQNDYAIQIQAGQQRIFNSHDIDLTETEHLKVSSIHSLGNLELNTTLFPLKALLDNHFSNFEIYLTLLGGFLGSIAVGALIRLWQLARSRIAAVEETKKQLEKMHRDLLFILDVAQIGAWVLYKEENTITWDDYAQKMFGTKDNEVRNLDKFNQIIDPLDREVMMGRIHESFKKGTPYEYTFKVRWEDNSVHYIISKGRPYFDENGKPLQITGVCWDITEIKLSQKFLELSEEIIRGLNESASVKDAGDKICQILYRAFGWEVLVIWLRDEKTNLIYCLEVAAHENIQFADFENSMHGLTLSQDNVIPQHVFLHHDQIWFEDFDQISPPDERLKSVEKAQLKGVFATPIFNGTDVIGFVELFRQKPLIDEVDEKFLNMMTSIGIDLGQFIAQRIAQSDQEQLASIVTYSTDGIFSTDLNGVIKSWNFGAERIYGWPENEIIGKNVLILMPEAKETELESLKHRLRTKNESIDRFETQRIRKDGQLIWVTNTYSGIKNHKGEVNAVSVVVHDITQRKMAIDRLQKSEEKFRTFVETTEEWIWEIDKDSRFIYSNPSVKKILGFSQNEVQGKELFLFIQEEAREFVRNGMKKSFEEKKGWTQRVYPYKDVNGLVCYLESNSEPIFDDHDQLIGFRGADRDITGRMQLEKSQNEFISIISHELRTPLTSIHGALGLVIADDKLSLRTKELMSIAYRNSERLRNLINDVLNIQKIQLGKLDVKIKSFDITDVVKESILSTNAMAKSYKITIIEEQDVPSIKALGDPQRVMQVLVNLLSNAIKFSFENGKVYVSIKNLGNFIQIIVRDDGIGIADDFRQKVFQRFAQADSSNSRSAEGTGLGLSICKNLVELMGGEIGFTSYKDKGSEFYFTLPISTKG